MLCNQSSSAEIWIMYVIASYALYASAGMLTILISAS